MNLKTELRELRKQVERLIEVVVAVHQRNGRMG